MNNPHFLAHMFEPECFLPGTQAVSVLRSQSTDVTNAHTHIYAGKHTHTHPDAQEDLRRKKLASVLCYLRLS